MDAGGYVMLTKEQQAALLEVLPMNGDSATLDVDADGTMRAGVTFTCMSAYPCTVTVSNSAGTIVRDVVPARRSGTERRVPWPWGSSRWSMRSQI